MKIKMEIKKEKNGYSIVMDKPCLVCYGGSIEDVFKHLKMAFTKLDKLNQLVELK
jgi:hypothetical protein